jgi:hypothetical protein
MSTSSILNQTAIIRVGYVLSLAGLTIGLAAIPFSLRVALLPASAIFGWSQIGGL